MRALDPWRELGIDEIEQLYAQRQTAPFLDLARHLLVAERPAEIKVLLCGARGSGKSTELVRLAREIQGEFCVIQADLAAGLPDTASTLAVVTLLGVAALHAIQIWSDPEAEPTAQVRNDASGAPGQRGAALLDGALKRFGEAAPAVSEMLTAIGAIVTPFAPGLAGAAVKAAGTASSRLRNALARGPLEGHLDPERREDARAVVDAVNTILEELAELAGRPPLLLADGLDKRTSVEQVELALNDEYLLRDLAAPLILTGPVNLRHDPRFRAVPGNFRLSLLYNVPVCEVLDDGRVGVAREGIEMLRGLYERRRSAAGLPAELIEDPLVERAAQLSAGIVRDFLRLLHSACMNALGAGRKAVNAADLDAAIKAQRLELEGFLDQGGIDTLRRVLDKRTVPSTADADTLLFENFIACYPNGDLWYRPHELIVDFVRAHSDPR